jgi:hypothetical protein
VDRWGQDHDVEIYNMILQDTLEGDILLRLQKKLEIIREQLGNVSDVLSVTGPLDLDILLMNGANDDEELPLPDAVERVDAQVEAALRDGQEALDACRAQFLIAPGAFGPAEYAEIARARALMQQGLPSASAVEQFVTNTLPLLGGQTRRIEDTTYLWSLDIPPELRRTGIKTRYEQATFEHETALSDQERPPTIDFIAPGHPLLQALIAAVKNDARMGIGKLSGRMSMRVLEDAPRGMLFTFLGRWQDKLGAVVAEELLPLFVGLDGSVLFPAEAEQLLLRREVRRNPKPDLLSSVYEPRWQELRDRAQILAGQFCSERAQEIAHARQPQLEILRHDIENWQEARLRYVERQLKQRYEDDTKQLKLFEEKEERDRRRALAAAESRRQKELTYQKLAIKLRREEREKEITAMEQIISVPPETIGALVIIAAEDC